MMLRSYWLALSVLGLVACDAETSTPEEPGPVEDPNANADGDCMTDKEELAAGTDPKKPDSDDDTITDCDEIELGSNPVLADSDSDGLTDPEEIACVSSP